MKRIMIAALTLGLCLTLVACSNNSGSTTSDTLTVGMECAYAPFNWSQMDKTDTSVEIDNNKGSYCDGYDVQIAKIVADKLGKTLVIKALDWTNLESGSAVNNGTVDIIFAGMNPTPTRAQAIDFTDAYYTSVYGIVVKTDSSFANATTIADFKGSKLITQTGTVQDKTFIDQVENVTHVPGTNTMPQAISSLLNNAVDGVVVEKPVAEVALSTNSNLKFIVFADGQGFTAEPSDLIISAGVKKNRDDNLVTQVNDILKTITTEQRDEIMSAAQQRQPAAN